MVIFSVKNEREFCATLGNELPSQSRGLEKEIHHEAISHGNAKSSHAMQNSKGSSCKENLEYFLESFVYILYIISKLKKSEVQFFKQCANRSWNEEVMIIWRQLRKIKRNFASPFPDAKIFALTFPDAKIFALTFPDAKIFALPFSNAKFFASSFSDAKM